MKKILILFIACILVGCSNYNSIPKSEVETVDSVQESSDLEQTNSVAATETASFLLETIKGESVIDTLSGEEKRKLNVFFSNFAEAHFDEYDCDNVSANDLIGFAFTHNRVNGTSKEEYDMFTSSFFEYIMGIRVEVMDKIIEKYFGVSVPHENTVSKNEHGRYEGWAFENGYVYTNAADGEFYDYCAIVNTLVDVGDGTYFAKYDKYCTELEKMDQKYYSYTPEQAQNDMELGYCSSYTAVIKPAVVDKKHTWQLLKLEEIQE